MTPPVVSIVLPFHDEAEALPTLFDRLRAVETAALVSFEYVLIDDGSTDASLRLARGLQADLGTERVQVIQLTRNFGHEAALSAGLHYARGDALVFMDSDLQHPPELIPALVAAWRAGAPIVFTRRTDEEGQSLLRRVGSAAFYRALELLGDQPPPRQFTDFRLIDRRVARVLSTMREKDRMFRGLVSWVGARDAAVVPFVAAPRRSGRSKYGLRSLMHLASVGVISFSLAPLRCSTLLGLLGFAVSTAMTVFTVYQHYALDSPKTGFATLVVLICFVGSLELIILGIMGEYLGRVLIEVKNRPLFVARKHHVDRDDCEFDAFV